MSTKRDRKRKPWSVDPMTRAAEAVRKSMGFTKAVKTFGVPRTTLRRLVHNTELTPELVVQKPLGRRPLNSNSFSGTFACFKYLKKPSSSGLKISKACPLPPKKQRKKLTIAYYFRSMECTF
ncbi:unnamed protein product [Acanthoscelides obtectus]|uniref:HTH psq-type domain-containing protein n=1 Tax=Acanthoscelides obtectus TaxID=200917 RepID=A0A9P0JXV5_ACAOB|nr:unnamed protein product [Acanthoscelides obtectus]CAK1632076.1 hypothetical protein AOBTE_LOCUS7350 [Acanthoscelides obtectus]